MAQRHLWWIYGGLALLVGIILVILLDEPGYADAYYYFNAGQRLAEGDGLTDPYLWNYLNAPDALPAPAHTYWMPMPSLAVAASIAVIPGSSFTVGQIPFVLALVGIIWLTLWIGTRLTDNLRQIQVAALVVLFGGFYFPYWTTTATFSLFALFGGLALITGGTGYARQDWRWLVASGAFAGLAHLTRADGLLLLLVLLFLIALIKPADSTHRSKFSNGDYLRLLIAPLLAYLLIMAPWFIRNLDVMGSPLPSGGVSTAFLTEYNDIFEYPVNWSTEDFFDQGIGGILNSRWEAFIPNLVTFFVVEGVAILMPFALYALWKRRREKTLTFFWIYALALHLVMTFIFPFPGYRGGLLHSSAALFPFWVVLGVTGVDEVAAAFGKWRGWERTRQAQRVFSGIIVGVALLLSVVLLSRWLITPPAEEDVPAESDLAELIREDYGTENPVLMMNNPAAWYYHTGLTGVTLPDAPLERLPEIARRYCVNYLVIDSRGVTEAFDPLLEADGTPPDFLSEVESFFIEIEGPAGNSTRTIRIYRFNQEQFANDCPTASN